MTRVAAARSDVAVRARRRFLVVVPLVLLCVLVCRARILALGTSYELDFPEYVGRTITEQNIQIEPPDMLTIASIEQDAEGVAHVVFEAGTPAKGTVLINFEDTGGAFEMQTTADGIVVAEGFDVMGWETVALSIVLVIACIGVLCLSATISLWRASWYGYEMAAYAGGALFFCLQALQFGVLHFSGALHTFSDFAAAVVTMANSFVELCAVPMAVLALFVSLSNVVLLRREGVGFTNLLGVAASIAWAAVFFGLRALHGALWELPLHPLLYVLVDSALSAVLAYAVALFAGVCITALLAARHMPAFPRDYLIILGCGLRADGTPTPLLAGRVDAALAYAARQQKDCGSAPVFVPSGGQGGDEACPEAVSMARYIERHAPGARVLLEDRSTTTRENMAYSAQVIEADAPAGDARVAFATTNYHVLRGYVFAHLAGMEVEGIAAPTKLYFWPNAFLREFAGMLVARALPIVMSCVAIVVLYGSLEMLLFLR